MSYHDARSKQEVDRVVRTCAAVHVITDAEVRFPEAVGGSNDADVSGTEPLGVSLLLPAIPLESFSGSKNQLSTRSQAGTQYKTCGKCE